MRYPFVLCLPILILGGLTACGGGSATPATSQLSAAPVVASVTSVCTPTTVAADSTVQCSATVTGSGSYSSSVTWSASAGAITAGGLLTAPASAGTVTVTATSTENPAKSGKASISVQPAASTPTISSIQVACTPATVNTSATSQCSAAVAGAGSYSSAVNWSASGGSVSANGLFTAPASAGAVTITATSTQDATKSGVASVTVQAAVAAPPAVPPAASQHVVMVMEENQSYDTVVRSAAWPHLNNLIANGALATNYYADSHPSIGNYLMLTTGQTLTTNDNSTAVWDVDNIARRMLAAGVSFRIYAESIPRGYVGGNTGLYLVRHEPFALLSDIAKNPQVAGEHIWPFSQFAADLAGGSLPQFSYIVPNIEDDAHNGSPQQADAWLQANVVNRLSNNPAFAPGGDGLLVVDFDEAADSDSRHGGGRVSAVFWGPDAKVGYTQTSTTLYQHQSMLRTLMEVLGLPNPPGSAAQAPSMSEFLAH